MDQLGVIGAGFGRTGTLSLKAALEELGFGPCYHMYELLGHLDHAPSWAAAHRGDTSALTTPLAGYRATVDWPGCIFWRELCDLYPDAKVVLSVRPADRWYDSFRETVGAVISMPIPPELAEMVPGMVDVSDGIVRDRSFGTDFDLDDRDRVIASYEQHNAAVRASVASDRLLEFDVAEGWEPLCAFLGVAVPDTAFPNINDREQFKALFGLDQAEASVTEDLIAESEHGFREAARGS